MDISKIIDKDYRNIPKYVLDKLNKNLYQIQYHPLEIIKNKIFEYFKSKHTDWIIKEDLPKIVSIEDNFDKLLISQTHPSRTKSNTYYLNSNQVLRTHTTAHQTQLFEQNIDSFLICGDVYRRDEIDSHHYNIFHQIEGACLYLDDDPIDLENKLLDLMKGLCDYLFPRCEYRIKPDYFPFTNPSYEIEVLYNSKWLEILGCGIIQPTILENSKRIGYKGIAWGMGLERLAMILFDIPDIRYFWMDDPKFLEQFNSGQIIKFKKFSSLEPIYKDVSMYIKSKDIDSDGNWIRINELYEEIRSQTNDLVGEIKCIDKFYNSQNQSQSYCFRLLYSPKDYTINNPSEFNNLVNIIQTNLVNHLRNIKWIEVIG